MYLPYILNVHIVLLIISFINTISLHFLQYYHKNLYFSNLLDIRRVIRNSMSSRITINKYDNKYRNDLLDTWELSVRNTHHFLQTHDFEEIKTLVYTIDFTAFDVYCAFYDDRFVGFVGASENKIEMLFLHPEYFRMGIGTLLLHYAIDKLGCTQVDVNEQNTSAYEFYVKTGFTVIGRNEKDGQGKDYPILSMVLEKTEVIVNKFNSFG